MGDSIKSYKPKDHTHKAKGLALFASVFSFFICISIFYILNHSPYTTLFNNNFFWFFMSNTLILIIAADYEAFSSSKEKQDLYEEYVKHSQARNYSVSSYIPKYEQVHEKSIHPIPKQELSGELLQEKKETVADDQKSEIPERVLEIVVQNDPKQKSSDSFNEIKPALPLQVEDSTKACEERRIPAARAVGRSKSDRYGIKRVVIDESKNTVRRSETMKVDARAEEENEFSTMTNEELNRRVEEFIQRFNRQIRLQAARNVHQI